MSIIPNDHWYWRFDEKSKQLVLDFANDKYFFYRFKPSALNSDALGSNAFTINDSSLFYLYEDNCRQLPLNQEQKIELILNSVAAHRFLKPLMPKSWYFVSQYNTLINPKNGQLVTAQLLNSTELIVFLVVEAGSQASLCALAQPVIQLADKQLLLGEMIKIMNNRFKGVITSSNNISSSLAQVV